MTEKVLGLGELGESAARLQERTEFRKGLLDEPLKTRPEPTKLHVDLGLDKPDAEIVTGRFPMKLTTRSENPGDSQHAVAEVVKLSPAEKKPVVKSTCGN